MTLLLFFAVSAGKLAENARWFFDSQLDHSKDGFVELEELVKTMTAVHPDACVVAEPGSTHKQLPSLDPFRRFIESRDSGVRDGKVSRAEFVQSVEDRFNFRTRNVAFGLADEQSSTLQFHLAWGSNGAESSMLLTFVNFVKASAPTIRYRVHGTSQYQYVACNTTTYDDGVFGWNGWIYSGQMNGLSAATTYDYGVALDGAGSNAFTADHTFTTARDAISPSSITRYAWYGDQGSYFPEGFVTAAAVVRFVAYVLSLIVSACHSAPRCAMRATATPQ
jgi:hypothetical protein